MVFLFFLIGLCGSNCAAAQLRLEMARKAVDNCNKALACDDFCARAYLVKGRPCL